MKRSSNRWSLSWATTIGVAAVLVVTPVRAAPTHVPVEIESQFPDEDPKRVQRVQPDLEERAADELKHEHGVKIDAAASTTIVFHVVNLDDNPKAQRKLAVMDYGVRIEVLVQGEQAGYKNVYCTEVGESELVRCAVAGIREVLEFVPTEEVEAPVSTAKDPPDDGPRDPQRAPERIPPIRGLGISGIVLGAAGLGLTIAGAVDLSRGDVMESKIAEGEDRFTDHRRRGRPLLGAGVGLLVAGIVMTAVDVGIQSKKRRASRRARIRPSIEKGYAGLVLQGRF